MVTQTTTQVPPAGSTNTYKATDGAELDADVVNIMKSIRKVESNGDYNAVGDSGKSHGAYQFYGDNYQTWAKQYKLDPEDESPVNQDKVAYYRIKEMKDQGNTHGEIAARWNGAKLVNGKYQAINPQYVEKVKAAYIQGEKKQGGYNPKPYSSGEIDLGAKVQPAATEAPKPAGEPGLGQQLMDRTNEAGSAIQGAISGKINPLSGILQTVGAGAGMIGDVTGAVLDKVPGVKQIEKLMGWGIGKLAQTDAGKSVINEMQKFATEHPEASANMGAAFNIMTAIPILKGLGVVKNMAMDAGAKALMNAAEKGMVKELIKVAPQTSSNIIQTAVKQRIIPNIVSTAKGTTFAAKDALTAVAKAIKAKPSATLTGIQDFLISIDGKMIPRSMIGQALRENAATGVGTAVGSLFGQPLVGGLVGHQVTGITDRAIGSLTPTAIKQGILKRTGKNAIKQKGVKTKIAGMVAGTAAQNANR